MTFRVHEHARRNGLDYRILSLPYMVAETEGPSTAKALIRQRGRWQRVFLVELDGPRDREISVLVLGDGVR